jgi:hypothetical protein
MADGLPVVLFAYQLGLKSMVEVLTRRRRMADPGDIPVTGRSFMQSAGSRGRRPDRDSWVRWSPPLALVRRPDPGHQATSRSRPQLLPAQALISLVGSDVEGAELLLDAAERAFSAADDEASPAFRHRRDTSCGCPQRSVAYRLRG